MSEKEHPRYSPWKLQKLTNEKLERGSLGLKLYSGTSLEFSNGITMRFKRAIGNKLLLITIEAPKDVKIHREVEPPKVKEEAVTDEQTSPSQG